ncbi:hypothetical protein BDK51DRAFT_31084, partial [Blyttiomyces helicus]
MDVDSASAPIDVNPGSHVFLSPSVMSPASPFPDLTSVAATANSAKSRGLGPERHGRVRTPQNEKYVQRRNTRHGLNLLHFQKDRFPRQSRGRTATHTDTMDKLLDLLVTIQARLGGNVVFTPAACEAARSKVAMATKE